MKRILLLFVILLTARVVYFTEPFGVSVDESTYLAMAEILHEGGVVYRDVVDRKPPGVLWTYQAIGSLFGEWNIHAIHFFGFLVSFLTALLAWSLSGSFFAGLLFAIFSSCLPRGIVAFNAEHLMMLFLAPACLGFMKSALSAGGPRLTSLFVFVSLAAVSTIFKQTGGIVFGLIYFVWVFVDYFKAPKDVLGFLQRQMSCALVSALALGGVFGAISVYFYSQGALQDFWYWFLFDGLSYVAQDAQDLNQHQSLAGSILPVVFSWFPLWFLAGERVLKDRSLSSSLLLGAILGSLLSLSLSGRIYTHYFMPLIFFLCVYAAPRLEARLQKPLSRITLFLSGYAVVVWILFMIFIPGQEITSDQWSFTKARQQELQEVAGWIRENTAPEDRIVVWGMASQIYVMSERGSATRFVFADFISGRLPGFKSSVSIPTPGMKEIFMDELLKNKPRLIIDTSTAGLNDYGYFPLTRFPELLEFIETNYARAVTVAGFEIWRLKDSNP